VRLKERGMNARVGSYEISIPFGAIKSENGVQLVGGGGEFQFLLVRLKARSGSKRLSTKAISIPFGAIKSRGKSGSF